MSGILAARFEKIFGHGGFVKKRSPSKAGTDILEVFDCFLTRVARACVRSSLDGRFLLGETREGGKDHGFVIFYGFSSSLDDGRQLMHVPGIYCMLEVD